jgi:addiction module RelE/StbE family toxin
MDDELYIIRWTGPARTDLMEIVDYIADNNPIAAIKILDKIEHSVNQLDMFPMRGRVVPELEQYGYLLYREIIISPWRVIYKIDQDIVYILVVIDGRRDVESILLKKLFNHELE